MSAEEEPPIGEMDALNPDIQRGKIYYLTYTCEKCHGLTGLGDGPQALTLKKKPRNLHDLSAYTQGSDEKSITKTILLGVKKNRVMRPFKEIPPEHARLIARYVLFLQKNQP